MSSQPNLIYTKHSVINCLDKVRVWVKCRQAGWQMNEECVGQTPLHSNVRIRFFSSDLYFNIQLTLYWSGFGGEGWENKESCSCLQVCFFLTVAKQREQVVKYKSLLTHKCQKKQLIPWGCSTSLLGPILGFRTSILAWQILGQVASSVIFGAEEKKGGGEGLVHPTSDGVTTLGNQEARQKAACFMCDLFSICL